MEHWQDYMHRQLHNCVQDWIKAGRPSGGPQRNAPGADSLPARPTGARNDEQAEVA